MTVSKREIILLNCIQMAKTDKILSDNLDQKGIFFISFFAFLQKFAFALWFEVTFSLLW